MEINLCSCYLSGAHLSLPILFAIFLGRALSKMEDLSICRRANRREWLQWPAVKVPYIMPIVSTTSHFTALPQRTCSHAKLSFRDPLTSSSAYTLPADISSLYAQTACADVVILSMVIAANAKQIESSTQVSLKLRFVYVLCARVQITPKYP